jgi:hypothetical protein
LISVAADMAATGCSGGPRKAEAHVALSRSPGVSEPQPSSASGLLHASSFESLEALTGDAPEDSVVTAGGKAGSAASHIARGPSARKKPF